MLEAGINDGGDKYLLLQLTVLKVVIKVGAQEILIKMGHLP